MIHHHEVITNSQIVSQSLIVSSARKRPNANNDLKKFCLGLPDWCPCCINDDEHPKKHTAADSTLERSEGGGSKALKLRRTKDNSGVPGEENAGVRFAFDVTSEDLESYKEGECSANTNKNNEWALRTFQAWVTARNIKYPTDPCPSNIFTTENHQELCDWLCKFTAEARKADGTEYTPRSLYLILAGLQRHIRRLRPTETFNLFHDPVFYPLKNVCDSVFKRLHSKGIGTDTKATPVLSVSEGDVLWKEGVINLNHPEGLLKNAVFFYNGKNFCLRGGLEHRNLKLSQVKKEVTTIDDKKVACYIYSECGSKNNQGGFASLNLKNKSVRQYQNDEDTERCHVRILDRYFEVNSSRSDKK